VTAEREVRGATRGSRGKGVNKERALGVTAERSVQIEISLTAENG
jgi:hypothetical protein